LWLRQARDRVGEKVISVANISWLANPQDDNFENPNNWSTGTVPGVASGGALDTAMFGTSSITALTISASGSDLNLPDFQFNSGAPSYSFTFSNPGRTYLLPESGQPQQPGVIKNLSVGTIDTFSVTNNTTLDFHSTFSAVNGAAFDLTTDSTSTIVFGVFGLPITPVRSEINSFVGVHGVVTTNGTLVFLNDTDPGLGTQLVTNAGGLVDFSATAGFNLNHTVQVQSISGAGTLNLGSNTLLIENSLSGSSVASGIIEGTGGSLVFDSFAKGRLTLAGSNTYSGGTTVESGTLLIDGSTANSAVTVDNGGTLGGTGTAGLVTVESGGTFAPGDPSTFTVAGLTLNSGATFGEEIGGSAPGTGGAGGYDQTVVESGGTISLGGATLDVSLVNGFAPSVGETFTIIDNETGNAVSGTFDGLAQGAVFEADGTWFQIAYDGGANNQDVTLTDVACYCRGTLILTEAGEVAVENLVVGDKVRTASGTTPPIKWIGRRSYVGRFVVGRMDILPICIKAGSLGDNVPKRDLWISPHHAMYLEGVLIEAKDLVNGVSIVQAERVEKVEYFHIELETHDVIVAEGALSETFVDDDSRGMFHNADEYRELYPQAASTVARYCAPRLDEGHEVAAIRRALALRAGLPAKQAAIGSLRGYVDRITPHVVEGWAQNADYPEAPVCLDICADGRLIGHALANRYRADLKQAGLGSGHHAFVFQPPTGALAPRSTIEVRRSLDSKPLWQTDWKRAPGHKRR
jgi:autotransporter-associated beta strand protein